MLIGDDGERVILPPPPPPPPPKPVIPAGTSSPEFTKALATARTATGQLTTRSSQVSVSQAVTDWGAVASAVADQYRQAIVDNKDNTQNQTAAIAALNKEFGSYFQGHQGETTVKIATTFDPKTGATTVRTEDELSNGAVTTQTTFPNGTAVTTAATGAGHTVTVVTEADGSKTTLAPGQDPTPKGTQPIIADMTAGKSIGLIAQERGLTYDQVLAQLQAAGFDVQTTTPMSENGIATVEIRDPATGRTVTEFQHPNSGNYSISVTDARGNQTTSPVRDSQGRKVTTTYDPTTGGTTTTHVNDLGDGSVVQETDLPSGVTVVTTTDKSGHSQTVVTDANGKQTNLAASQVPSRQGAQPIVQDIATGKSIDQIAAEHGWTRDQVLAQLAAAGLALKTSSGNGVNSTSVVDQHGGQAIATHSTQADGSQTTEYTDADGNHHVVRTTPFIGPVVGTRPSASTETVTEPNGRTTQTMTAMDGKKTVAVTFNGYTLMTAPDGSKTLTDQATGNTITIKAGSADDALAQLLTSVDPHSSDPAKAKEGQVIVSTVGSIFAGEELPGATQAASDADANLKAIIAKYGAPTQAQPTQDSKNHIVDPMGNPPPGKAPSGGAWAPVEINGTWYWADPEVAKAVIADDIAQTQLAQVQGVAGQRQAQVDVYALDPSYKGATSDARSVINQALAPLNLVLKPTKPDGTLQQAQDRLTATNAYLTDVGDALGSYQAAASLLDTAIAQNNGLKPVLDPNVPAFTKPGTNRQADYYQAVAAHAQVQSLFSQIGLDTSQGDLSTVNAMVALSGTADAPAGTLPAGVQPVEITVGGQTIEVAPDVAAKYQQNGIGALTDKGVKAVAIEVDVTNPNGTTSKQWRWVDPQLALQKISADSTVQLAGAYNDYFAAHSRFTSLDVQYQALQQQLVSNYFSKRPDLLQPGATFSNVDGSKYYGKYEGDTVQVRADGQVWLVLQFEHGTNDIQLTFSPNDNNAGEESRNSPLNRQWQALWQGDLNQCRLDSYNDIKAADLQAGVTLNTLLDKQIGIQTAGLNQELSALRGQYGDALTKYGSGSATAPQGTLPAGAQPVAITIAGQTIMVAPTVAQSYLAGNPSDFSALISATAIEVNMPVTDRSGRTHRERRWVAPRLAVLQLQIAQTQVQLSQLDNLHLWLQGAISSDKVHLSEPQLLGVTDPSVDKTLLDDHRQQALDGIYQGQFQNLQANGYGTFKTLSGADLETTVATTLGLNATGNSDAVKKITDEIHDVGGNTPMVSLVPIFYVDDAGGSQQTVLFAVKDKGDSSKTWYVDATGRRFSDLKEFQDNNRQFSENGELVVPANLNMTTGSDGKIALQVVKARNVSAWDRIADPVIGGIATVATIASFTPLAPIAVPIAVTSGLYFAGRAVIKERAYLETGGQWTDTESLMNIGTVAMGVLPEASGGLRFLGMARALNMTRSETLLAAFGIARTTGSISAVGDVGGFGRVWYALPHAQQFGTYFETAGGLNTVAHVTDAAGMLIGAGQTGYSAVNLAEHGGDMSGIDLINSLTNLGIGITGTGLGARSFLDYAGGPHTTSMSFTDAGGQRVNAIVAVDDRPASEDQVYIPSPDDGPVTVAGLVSAGYTHVLVRDPQTNQAVVVSLTSGKGPSTAKTTDSIVTTSDVTVAGDHISTTASEGVLPFFMEPIAMKEFADNRNSESSKEKQPVWKPSSAGQTLIIGRKAGREAVSGEQTDDESGGIAVGQTPPADVPDDADGPIAKQATEGEVYLGTDPAEEPDIVGDIGGKTLIPDDHFSTVVFREYVFSSLMEGSSLGEAYRVLKSGGTLRIEATAGAARDSDAVISKLEDAGFENVVLAEVEGLHEATDTPYEFKASKPSVAGELERALTPVNELARQQFGVDLLREGKGVPVLVLGDDGFGELYDIVGGAGDPADVLAFTRSDSDGNPTFIAVREDAADVPTLTHELIHSRTSPEFKKVAQQFVLNPDQSYSNLGEEVVNFLVSQLMSGADSPRTAVVSDIFQEMGKGEFYRAVFDGDSDAIDTFSEVAADKFGAPRESRPLELVEAKTTPLTMPSDMPSRPALTAEQLKGILNAAFENRSSRLSSKIQNAGRSDSVFLDPSSKDEVKAVLLNAWKGALLDPAAGAKAHTTNDTDAEFMQQLVGYIQQNKLEMQVPGGSSLALHFTPDEIDQLRTSWNNTPSGTMANIDQFLDHLLSGAHFVIPRLTKSASDFFSAFTVGKLNKSTKRVLANTHYVKEGGVLSHLPASERWRFSRGGLRYPNNIKSDETPNNPAILSALLVGRTRQTARSDEGDTYFQVEGWPPVAREGFLGRHFADTKTHQDNGDWNISTYGASTFGEKREQGKYGNAIQLKPSDETRLGLMLAKQTDDFTSQLLDDQSKISAFVGKIETAVKGEADKAVDDALELAQTGNAHKATSKALHKLAQSNRFGRGVVRKEGAAIVADAVGGRTDVTGEIIRSVTRADLKTQRQRYWPLSSGSRWQRHGAQELAESATSAARVKVAADVKTKADMELDALAGDGQRGGKAGWTRSDYVKSLLDIKGASEEILPGLLKTKVGEALEALLGQTGMTPAQQLSRLESDPDGLLTDVLRILNDQNASLDPADDAVLHESGGNVAAVAAYQASGEVWKTTRAEAGRTAKPELTKVITDTLNQRATAKAGEISASLKDWIADQAASQQNLRTLRERLTRQDRLGNIRTEALAEAKSRWEQRLNTDANEISDAVLNGVLDDYVRNAENSPSGADPASTIPREGFAASVSQAAQDIIATRPALEEKQVLAAAQIAVESLKHVLDGDDSGSEKLVELWNAAQSAFGNPSDPALTSARGTARDAVVAAVREDVKSRTADTTEAAADWIARDPDFKQGTLRAAQESISVQFKDANEFASSLGKKRAAEGMARTEARREAGPKKQAPVIAAKTKANEMFDAGLPEAVLEQNFKPNPQDYTLSKWERRITQLMERHMRNVTYTAQAYEEILGLLPEQLRAKLPKDLSKFEVDQMTQMLAEVPAGLEQIIADIHSHPMGYDRREGNLVLGLINKGGEFSRILSGSIPQWCGGDGHYSTATPSKATMKRAYELDQRAVKDWLEIYAGNGKDLKADPQKAAQVDLSITGVNFADAVKLAKIFPNPDAMHEAFRDPTGYITKMMMEHPGMFPAIGEITGIKEMVTRQLGGWRWNVGSQKFQKFLSLANETGQVVVLHNDWGEHAESAAGRPSAAKQHYEHLSLLKYVFSRPEYRNVQIVFAHTGIGRLVRPDDEMSTSTREYTIKKFDPKTGQVDESSPAAKKKITAPEHIHQLYQLFEAVPNARVDISWNDVTQAYTHLMQTDSAAAKAVVDFFIDHQDRILFGSDTVKPVNPGHYNQALMTGAPLFVDITRRDPDAAFKILRGNYDDAMKLAYQRSDAWTKTQLLDGANKPSPAVSEKIRKMEDLRQELDGFRDQLGANARTQFDQWAAKVGVDWSQEAKGASPGVYQILAKQLPHSTPLDRNEGVLNGPGTSGGTKNGVWWRRYGTGVTSIASMAGAGVAAHFGMPGLDHAGYLTPTTGGGFTETMAGSNIANALTSGGFLVRGLMSFGRTAYLEQLRLQWEQIFEQGAVTRDGLNRYVSRLFNAAPYLGITALQRAHISAATEQFWKDYTYLRDQPLSANYTEQQRFLALHAKIGEYMITVSREGNLQESSLSAADSRRFEGRWFRSGLLATYGINEAVALNWMETSGLHQIFSMQFLHQGSILADAQSASELAYRSLFLLGNAMLMTREGNSLIGGLFGISGMETNRLQKALQRWGQLTLGAGGIGWTINGGLSTAAAISSATHADSWGNGTTAALDMATTIARAAFTWAALRGYGDEFNRAHALPMSGPLKLSKPQLVLAGALGAAMIISLTQIGWAASMPMPSVTPVPTPTKKPSVAPTRTALVTPSATPSVAPTATPSMSPSVSPLPGKTAHGGRHH